MPRSWSSLRNSATPRCSTRSPRGTGVRSCSTTSSTIRGCGALATPSSTRWLRTTSRWSRTSISRAGPSGLAGANPLLFRLPVLLEAPLFRGDLLLDLVHLVGVPPREGLLQALLQEDLPLRQLPLVDAVDVREPCALFRGDGSRGGRVRLGQALHRQFVGAFHGGAKGSHPFG